MANNDGKGPGDNLSADEAKEFHKLFMTSFIIFTIVAIIAHFLVWNWRPWLPGPDGYAALETGGQLALNSVTSLFA